jgi:phosphomethylpyrimidine synthase
MIGWFGTRCSATSRRRSISACPNRDDVKVGVITYKIAAHAADLAKGHPAAQLRDDALSRRASISAGRTSSTSGSIPTPRAPIHDETLPKEAHKVAHFCSMCGPKFCSMKITQDVRDYAATAAEKGMAEMSAKFKQMGGEVYVEAEKVKESNKSL